MAHGGHGGQEDGVFGYTLNLFSNNGQQGIDHTGFAQPGILDENEAGLLNSFFNNPDDPRVSSGGMQHSADQFTFGMDGKVDHNTDFTFNRASSAMYPASTSAEGASTNYMTHSSSAMMQSAQPHGGEYVHSPPEAHAHVDNDDMNGATSLLNMRSSQSNEHGGQSASSWGAFGMDTLGNAFGNPGLAGATTGSRMTSRSSSDSHLTHDPFWLHKQNAELSTMQQYHHQAAALQQLRSPGLHANTAHGHVYGQQMPYTAPANGYHHFPQVPRFGGDPNFQGGPFAYSASEYYQTIRDKGGNLVQVPLAEQAAMSAPIRRQMTHDQRTYHMDKLPESAARVDQSETIGGLPMTPHGIVGMQQRYPQWTSHNNRVTNADDDEEEARPGKRRKSRPELEDEEEYRPEREQASNKRGPKIPKAEPASDDEEYEYAAPKATPSTKRRRPSSAYTGNSPASPAEGSARKRSIVKGRSNLSEEEKRANHIRSEQKRRNVIRQGYNDLDHLVPKLMQGKSGLSRADQVKETVLFLESTMSANDKLKHMLGVPPDAFEDLIQESRAY